MSSLAGTRLDHFEIIEKLGAGGMGEVYRARDLDLGREVAVKLLPERFAADPKRLARFSKEAQAASGLNHPSIVTVHEIGEGEGLHYIVMELVEGVTLRKLITAGRPLPTRRALDVAVPMAQGLAAAHAVGIVHRDLKPDNVMVRSDGYVKVLDFGLAKLLGVSSDSDPEATPGGEGDGPTVSTPADQAVTEAGTILGTAGYMSPEQASAGRADFRSDQFSFGAILYEMLSGRRAFKRDSPPQTLAAIIEDEPEPLADLNPSLPAPLVWIVERCLAKDPSSRYASTLDLVRELEKVRTHLDELSGVRTSPSGGPAVRRRRWILGAGAAALAVVAGLLGSPAVRERARSILLPPSVPAEKHVVVLPFATPTADSGEKAFAEGVVETLVSKLTRLERSSFWIVPMTDVRQLGVASVRSAKEAFGATLVVTGSLQRSGDRVRLTANLVDATTLRQIRSIQPVDVPVDDLAVMQDGLVEHVVRMIGLAVSPEEEKKIAAGRTSVGGAHALYVEGRGYLQEYQDEDSLDLAVSRFQHALELDPDYALAYAGMGEAQWRKYRLVKDPALVELATRACEEALRRNELLAPVHVTLGVIAAGTGRGEEAERALRRALALDPFSAEAHRELATVHLAAGRPEEAEAVYRRAITLRPDYWSGYSHLGVFLLGRGRLPEAEAQFKRAVALSPGNARGHTNLAAVYQRQGRYPEAETSLERALELRPTAAAHSNLAAIRFYRGAYAEAARSLEQATLLGTRDFRVWRNLGAALYWAPGERERSGDAYAKAAELGEGERSLTPRDPGLAVRLADCYAMLGKAEPARALVADALRLAPGHAETVFLAGTVVEQLGDRARALELVGRAYQLGYSRVEAEARPDLAGLRRDPRYPRS